MRPNAGVFFLVALVEIGVDAAFQLFDGIEFEGTAADVLLVWHEQRIARLIGATTKVL